ncbi:MAG TPA: hypothetical protein V6C57_17960 [Coleofasciculaceae cyanobacterium]
MVAGSQRAIASPPPTPAPHAAMQVAQGADSGCRQTNAVTGVYEQPSLDSASRGILSMSQTVRLELVGTGTGWARISQPIVGWVEARYLTPMAACDRLSTSPTPTATATAAAQAAPADNSFPEPDLQRVQPNRPQEATQAGASPGNPAPGGTSPNNSAPRGTAPGSNASGNTGTGRTAAGRTGTGNSQITAVTCQVLPSAGLIVRSQPTLGDETYLDTIPPGTYRFQFTRDTSTNQTPEGIRRWVYITAPRQGWISLGYVGKEFNLGGSECG